MNDVPDLHRTGKRTKKNGSKVLKHVISSHGSETIATLQHLPKQMRNQTVTRILHGTRQRTEQSTQEAGKKKHLRNYFDRRVIHTGEGLKNIPNSSTNDDLNTDHKDVAVLRESSRIFTHPRMYENELRDDYSMLSDAMLAHRRSWCRSNFRSRACRLSSNISEVARI